jgi:hypothetical protein
MSALKTCLMSLAAMSSVASLLILACSDEGTTTSCTDMPVLSEGASVAELEAWWDEAVKDGCATPRGAPPGAAGSPN